VSRRPVASVSCVFLAAALVWAAASRADDAKTYRWVGEDGHVYTSTTPPPNGKGLIDAPKPQPAKQSAQPAAPATPSAPQPGVFPSYIAAPRAPVPAAPAPAGEDAGCESHSELLARWRAAKQRVDYLDQSIDQMQSDTNSYMYRNDSSYLARLEAMERQSALAQDALSDVESRAQRAGVPMRCLGD
jgi:uncharacterized protein DUF4124